MFFLTMFSGKFVDAMSCKKRPEISIDNFQIQEVVNKDMTLEVICFKYHDLCKIFTEKRRHQKH